MAVCFDTQAPDIERMARRRASAKLGFFIHLTVYIAVNTFLALGAASMGRTWAIYPALGWGLGLLIHGVVVFFVTGGGGLYNTLLQRERDRLQSNRA